MTELDKELAIDEEEPRKRGRGKPFVKGDDERRRSPMPGTEPEIIAAARVRAARRLYQLVADRDAATALEAIRTLSAWTVQNDKEA